MISDFQDDIQSITKDNPIEIASLLVGEVRTIVINKDVTFDISEVDNAKLKFHCGLFISVNGKKIVGGEPFVTKTGEAVDGLVLQAKLALAKLASNRIKTITRK